MSVNEQFEDFAVAAWPRLVRSAQLLGLSPNDAEEAAQATLVACYSRWRTVGRLAESPHAYAYRALLNHYRSRARRNREHLVAEVPDEAVDASGGASSLLEAVQRLGQRQREVMVCRFYLDMSEAQTADVLGIAVGTAKSRTHRAIDHLQRMLNEEITHGEQ